jgi:MFS family permease
MIGCGAGLFYTASWALGTTIVPKGQAGLYLGLSNIAGAGAGAIGAYIGGPIGDKFGFSVLMIVYGLVVLLSGLAFVEVKSMFIPAVVKTEMRVNEAEESVLER